MTSSTALTTRCKDMILGALVADAAAMGLHWIYDQPHIRKIAPATPEFTPPNAANYAGVPAFFAHPNRMAGDQSQYGEQALVMLRMLNDKHGAFCAADFTDAFRAHFGYGGVYVGYIDHATRDTLDNARRFEDAATEAAIALGPDIDARVRKTLVAKALPLLARHSGAALEKAFADLLQAEYEDDAIRSYGSALLDKLQALPRPAGAVDLQLPALAKLPALIAALVVKGETDIGDAVASAVRTTSDHPVAAAYGQIGGQMMRAALTEGTKEAVVAAAQTAASDDAARLITQALEMSEQDNIQATAHFGMACDLPYGVPSVLHNITTAPDFTTAIRQNIYAGGDSCGRAILLGAVMGALYGREGAQGIPQAWISKLSAQNEVARLSQAILD